MNGTTSVALRLSWENIPRCMHKAVSLYQVPGITEGLRIVWYVSRRTSNVNIYIYIYIHYKYQFLIVLRNVVYIIYYIYIQQSKLSYVGLSTGIGVFATGDQYVHNETLMNAAKHFRAHTHRTYTCYHLVLGFVLHVLVRVLSVPIPYYITCALLCCV